MCSHIAGSRDADLPRIIDNKHLLQSDWPAVHSAWLHNLGVCFLPDSLPHSAKGASLQTNAPPPCIVTPSDQKGQKTISPSNTFT